MKQTSLRDGRDFMPDRGLKSTATGRHRYAMESPNHPQTPLRAQWSWAQNVVLKWSLGTRANQGGVHEKRESNQLNLNLNPRRYGGDYD